MTAGTAHAAFASHAELVAEEIELIVRHTRALLRVNEPFLMYTPPLRESALAARGLGGFADLAVPARRCPPSPIHPTGSASCWWHRCRHPGRCRRFPRTGGSRAGSHPVFDKIDVVKSDGAARRVKSASGRILAGAASGNVRSDGDVGHRHIAAIIQQAGTLRLGTEEETFGERETLDRHTRRGGDVEHTAKRAGVKR